MLENPSSGKLKVDGFFRHVFMPEDTEQRPGGAEFSTWEVWEGFWRTGARPHHAEQCGGRRPRCAAAPPLGAGTPAGHQNTHGTRGPAVRHTVACHFQFSKV